MNKSESKYFNTARRMDDALLSLLVEKEFPYITINEICRRAGVNRSTFYLHYENTADLLKETLAMAEERFQSDAADEPNRLPPVETAPLERLFLITDRWLLPYLKFIQENRHLYKAVHTQGEVFGAEQTYRNMFQTIFSPILSRYGVDETLHEHIMAFYRYGLVAVLTKWVESDCAEPPEEIARVIKLCVGQPLT